MREGGGDGEDHFGDRGRDRAGEFVDRRVDSEVPVPSVSSASCSCGKREREARAQEFEDPFPTRVDANLSAHPLGQTPHEAYDVLARLADQAQREPLTEVRKVPVRFEEDEEF